MVGGCQGLGTSMKLEERGLAEGPDVAELCFWILGQGPGELCTSRALRTGVGEEPDRGGEKQNRLCPGAEEKPFPPVPLLTGCGIWREETQLQLFSLLSLVPPGAGPAPTPRALHMQSSSRRAALRPCQPRLRARCRPACFQQTAVFQTLQSKAKLCWPHSFCICLFFLVKN